METLKRFLKDEEGVTSLEYALIAAVTCVAIIATLLLIKPQLSTIWGKIAGALTT